MVCACESKICRIMTPKYYLWVRPLFFHSDESWSGAFLCPPWSHCPALSMRRHQKHYLDIYTHGIKLIHNFTENLTWIQMQIFYIHNFLRFLTQTRNNYMQTQLRTEKLSRIIFKSAHICNYAFYNQGICYLYIFCLLFLLTQITNSSIFHQTSVQNIFLHHLSFWDQAQWYELKPNVLKSDSWLTCHLIEPRFTHSCIM